MNHPIHSRPNTLFRHHLPMKMRIGLAGLLLVAAFFPSRLSAKQLKFQEMAFFESSQREKPVNLESTVNGRVFVQGLTRYLYCRVSLWNNLQGVRDQNVRLTLKGFMSDGSFLGEISEALAVQSTMIGDSVIIRLPWSEPREWAVGTYRIEAYLDGVFVGKDKFDISLAADSLKIQFFESGNEVPGRAGRTYATSFAKAGARRINGEVSFNSSYDLTLAKSLKLSLKYYQPDGSLMGVPTTDIKSYEAHDNIMLGWGWPDPGHWPAGTYTVEAYLDGGYIGKSGFDVYESTSANQDPFDIGKRLALAGRYEQDLKIYVRDNWTGDGQASSLHLEYDQGRDAVVFCQRPLSGQGVMMMWVKNVRDRTYVKLIGDAATNNWADTIPISREQAEREAWRILKFFSY